MPQPRPLPRALEQLEDRAVPAVTVRFDYSQDAKGFFADPAKKAALERAASEIESNVGDTLAAIVPSSGNSWTTSFENPNTGTLTSIPNLKINQDEIVVYVAGGDLDTGELGLTTSGGFSATGSRDWLNTVRARGQSGALDANNKTDFSTWGGMITFDADAAWSTSTDGPKADQYDFQTVALHELMHVFGFGLGEPAFVRNVSNDRLAGPAVLAATNGAGAAVTGDPVVDHFAQGTSYNGQESPMQPALMTGLRRHLTGLDVAALRDIGWSGSQSPPPAVAAVPPVATVPPTAPVVRTPVAATPAVADTPAQVEIAADGPAAPAANPVLAANTPLVAVGSDAAVNVYAAGGVLLRTAYPFGADHTGGVRVATADVTGDGVADLVAGTGPGRPAEVRVLDGVTGNVVAVASPFEASFTAGVYVAAADLDGDGKAEVVVTPDVLGGPVVSVYGGAALSAGLAQELAHFWGMNDPAFRGGLRPALGDLTGDGVPDLALAAGVGGGPRVSVLDGRAVLSGRPISVAPDFFAFDSNLRGGANVAFADVDGDGQLDLVAGAGAGGGPRVTAFSGKELLRGVRRPVADFFAGDPKSRTGVRLASADLDRNGLPDLIAGTDDRAFGYTAAAGVEPTLDLPLAGRSGASGVFIG